MASLSSLTPEIVERRYPRFNFHLTQDWMRDFLELSGYRLKFENQKQQLPAASVVCLRDAEFFVIKSLGIKLNQLLHTTQKYEYIQSLYVGDRIETEAGVKRVHHRKTGEGAVVVLEMYNHFYRQESLVAKSSGTVFVREEPSS